MADREENTESGGKRSVQKLFDIYDPRMEWVMVIGTAGSGPVGDLAVRAIRKAANTNPRTFLDNHEEIISQELKNIHAKYIPEHRLDRAIWLVVGIGDMKDMERQYLYRSCEDLLQPQDYFACAGAGQEIANYFLDRLYDPDLTEQQVTDLASFILREAKESVGGVGKGSEFVFINKANDKNVMYGHYTPEFGSALEQLGLPQLSECMDKFWLKPWKNPIK